MSTAPGLRTGLVLDLEELLPDVAAVRRAAAPESAAAGIPLHVTVLFPFAPADELAAHEAPLEALLAGLGPCDVVLERVASWPGVVYAEPEASPALLGLMRAVMDAFPAFPPYGGQHPDPAPHATLALPPPGTEAAVAERLGEELASLLPARVTVTGVTVMRESPADRWRRAAVLPLGAAA